MTKAAPWVKFFASDFLTGVGDLQADEIGAYMVVLALIWDRGAPIQDDSSWLARRAGTSTRRFNQIRARLIETGKLEARNGLLGNRRAISAVEDRDRKSSQSRAAALARWHGHNQPELPFEKQADYLEIKTGKTQEQTDLESSKSDHKAQKPAKAAMRTHDSLSRARATPEDSESIQTNDHTNLEGSEADRSLGPDPDLIQLLDAVSDASGYRPVQPGEISVSIDIIKAWRDAGIDFETTVLPVIRTVVADSPDPTSSLKRFDKRVRHEHARARGRKANGSRPPEPQEPVLQPPDEPESFRPLRQALLDRHGARFYCSAFNGIRFEDVGLCHGDKHPLRITGPSHLIENLRHGPNRSTLMVVAAEHGFTEVW